MSDQNNIRRLGDDDVEQFRTLRLESLQLAPEAYPTRYDDASAEELGYFQGLLRKNIIMGVFDDANKLIGIAGYGQRQDRPKMAHTGRIWGIYIKPDARGKGFGEKLIRTLLEQIPSNIERTYMSIVSRNETSVGLYEKLGFETYGRRPKSLKDGDNYYDQILMCKEMS